MPWVGMHGAEAQVKLLGSTRQPQQDLVIIHFPHLRGLNLCTTTPDFGRYTGVCAAGAIAQVVGWKAGGFPMPGFPWSYGIMRRIRQL